MAEQERNRTKMRLTLENSENEIKRIKAEKETEIRNIRSDADDNIRKSQRQASDDVAMEKERSRKMLISIREQINADRDTLVSTSDKELLVQTVMTLGGYGSRLDRIESYMTDISNKAKHQQMGVQALQSNLEVINSN